MGSPSADDDRNDLIHELMVAVRSIKRARTHPTRLEAEVRAAQAHAKVRRVLLEDALASGMSQADVARARGVSKQAVSAEVKRNRLTTLEAAQTPPESAIPVQNAPGRPARRWSWREILRR